MNLQAAGTNHQKVNLLRPDVINGQTGLGNQKKLVKTMTSLLVRASIVVAGNSRRERRAIRTDINPGDAVLSGVHWGPGFSQTDRDYLFRMNGEAKAPERFGELVAV